MRLDVALLPVFMQTRSQDPLLCLTVSATLRDKEAISGPLHEYLSHVPSRMSAGVAASATSSNSDEDDSSGEDEESEKAEHDGDDDLMHGFEEVNLLDGLSQGNTRFFFACPLPISGVS